MGLRRHGLLLLLAALPAARPANAQRLGAELADAGHDALRILASPAHIQTDDLPTLGAVIGGAVVVGALDAPIQRWIDRHEGSLLVRAATPFREGSPLSRLGLAGTLWPVSGALYLAGLIADDRALRDAGLGCGATLAASTTIRHAIYRLVSRPRPGTGERPYAISVPGGDWEHHSFFAGHTSNIVGCTAFWDRRFRLGAAALPLYALAAGVSVSRTIDGAHWASDTYVGVAFGYAAGRLVADRMRGRVEPRTTEPDPALVLVVRWPAR
ncbi:MAG TPA: phosphatase PAP2 family protein [Longimicrobiales bacterium]|nr:phosphatase PAP2 family protein [Longimicrobiales bacterium]